VADEFRGTKVQAPETEETIDLREYIAILRARKWTIILTAALVVIAALAFSLQQTPLYTAEARLLVEPVPSQEEESLPPIVNLETERELVQSVPVAELVKEELSIDTPVDELLKDLDVQVVTETEVLIVAYTSDDPAFSQGAANAFAEGYITNRRNQALANLRAARSDVQRNIDGVEAQIAELEERIADAEAAADEGAVTTLESQRPGLDTELGLLQLELQGLQPGNAIRSGGGQVLAPATLPASPSSPNLLRNGLLAAFLGLALGVGLAFLRERLEDRFKSREDVERTLAAPVLATIPRFAGKRKDDPSKLILRTDPHSLASESYRSLRTNLEFIASTTGRNSFLITSPSAGEGKSVTAANVALAFAQSGRRTIVVSGDLRRPTIERIFGVQPNDGLSRYLAGQTDRLEEIIVNPGISNLRIVPTGPVPPNPAELMTSPRMAKLIADLEANSDMLLIDSAPTLPVADATIMVSHVGGAVLVVNAETTRRAAADHGRSELVKVGGRLVGGVLNSYDPTTSPYSYYQTYNYDSPGPANGREDETAREPEKSSRFSFRK
jgi:succinoglycan biosynthesis transport protein ExoP